MRLYTQCVIGTNRFLSLQFENTRSTTGLVTHISLTLSRFFFLIGKENEAVVLLLVEVGV